MHYRPLLLPLALALAACSQAPAPAAAPPAQGAAAQAGPAASATPAQLEKYHWQLTGATSADGKRIDALFARPDQPLQLDFAGDRLSVANACNRLGGSYRIDGDRLQLKPMTQTMMACADRAIAELDGAIAQRLQGRPKLSLQAGADTLQLRLLTDGGDNLVFNGQPTAETRYGGAGETVFLEVAPQTQPCSHPMMPNAQCLQVRERKYGENGVAAGTPGAWQPLYQNIEGYTHEAGIRNVLRVKRFAVKNPPADAPNTAYVLDMVVESEVVKP
jgi:heat shock protein HslJ